MENNSHIPNHQPAWGFHYRNGVTSNIVQRKVWMVIFFNVGTLIHQVTRPREIWVTLPRNRTWTAPATASDRPGASLTCSPHPDRRQRPHQVWPPTEPGRTKIGWNQWHRDHGWYGPIVGICLVKPRVETDVSHKEALGLLDHQAGQIIKPDSRTHESHPTKASNTPHCMVQYLLVSTTKAMVSRGSFMWAGWDYYPDDDWK